MYNKFGDTFRNIPLIKKNRAAAYHFLAQSACVTRYILHVFRRIIISTYKPQNNKPLYSMDR